jgi:type II secretion system protein H
MVHPVPKPGRGFTLVELSVVLAVMIIAAVAVIPSFVRYQRRAQLNWAVRRTVAFSREARGLAVARDTTVTLGLDEAAHGIRFTVEPAEVDLEEQEHPPAEVPIAERQSSDTRLLEYPLDVEVRVENPQEQPAAAVRFYADGRADDARVRFNLDGFPPVTLVVNPRTGRAAVEEEERP